MRHSRDQKEPLNESFRDFILRHGERALLDGSHFAGTLEQWKQQRRAIVDYVKDGSILDFGCANGFLLRSLQEWSEKSLDPYGIDQDEQMVDSSKELFPRWRDHFVTSKEIEDTAGSLSETLPNKFDNVFWNVWDDFDLNSERGVTGLQWLHDHVKTDGVLILGFYHSDKSHNEENLEKLKGLGWKIVSWKVVDDGRPEIIAQIAPMLHED